MGILFGGWAREAEEEAASGYIPSVETKKWDIEDYRFSYDGRMFYVGDIYIIDGSQYYLQEINKERRTAKLTQVGNTADVFWKVLDWESLATRAKLESILTGELK